jgi:8-oxo-dGTP pyrophosphatase MutT (NUDIX family)
MTHQDNQHNHPYTITLDQVREALNLNNFDVMSAWKQMAPQSRRMVPPTGQKNKVRPASVLILLYPLNGELTFVLTRRADTLPHHTGQISLPGGAREPGETDNQTALRETAEELQINVEAVELIGHLAPLYVAASNYHIHPVVGYLPQQPHFKPDPVEVAEVLEMSLPMLLDETIKEIETWTLHGLKVDVPFYRVHQQIVWGATAIMLSEFEGRLRAVLNSC